METSNAIYVENGTATSANNPIKATHVMIGRRNLMMELLLSWESRNALNAGQESKEIKDATT